MTRENDGDPVDGEPTDGLPAEAGPTDGDGSTDGDGGVAAGPVTTKATTGPKRRSLTGRLYHGETNVDFVGRRKIWFTISAVLVLVSLLALVTRELNLGIDFEGGDVWEVPAGDASVSDARSAVEGAGIDGATITELESDEGREIRVEADTTTPERSVNVAQALAEVTGSTVDEVDLNSVGPSWGREISAKALRALVVFLVLVTIYIALRFEVKMAIPTLVALIHDVVVTVGVYSLTQLEVTPATVIAVLTILGYSIYDGIVVFDKVEENTRRVSSTGGLSYGGMVNVSLNQALMRSLNTTVTALLPVGSLLIVGSWILGAATLEEFAIALLIGLFSGAYSSLFLASPLLAVLKEREPRYRDIRDRVAARGGDREVVAATIAAGGGPVQRAPRPAATTGSASGGGADAGSGATTTAQPRAIPPRPRKKSKGRR